VTKKRKPGEPPPPFGQKQRQELTAHAWLDPIDPRLIKKNKRAAGPGGTARGKQKIEAADIWRKPAVEFANKIWQESPKLSSATVRQRIRKFLPEDKHPSDRALEDHIRPLKPQK
jgi:hypothetical protein